MWPYGIWVCARVCAGVRGPAQSSRRTMFIICGHTQPDIINLVIFIFLTNRAADKAKSKLKSKLACLLLMFNKTWNYFEGNRCWLDCGKWWWTMLGRWDGGGGRGRMRERMDMAQIGPKTNRRRHCKEVCQNNEREREREQTKHKRENDSRRVTLAMAHFVGTTSGEASRLAGRNTYGAGR